MRYDITYGQIKKTEKSDGTEDILKINVVYPQINTDGGKEGDKFAAAFNDLYEKAANNYVDFAETNLKKAAENKFALFEAAKREKIIPRHEKFIPFGAVFKSQAEYPDDETIRVSIDVSVYPGKSKRIVHMFNPREIKFLKTKTYL